MFPVLWLQLQKMLKENEEVDQIEKLARHEFDLDIEEQRRLQANCESEVSQVTTLCAFNIMFIHLITQIAADLVGL